MAVKSYSSMLVPVYMSNIKNLWDGVSKGKEKFESNLVGLWTSSQDFRTSWNYLFLNSMLQFSCSKTAHRSSWSLKFLWKSSPIEMLDVQISFQAEYQCGLNKWCIQKSIKHNSTVSSIPIQLASKWLYFHNCWP